MGGKTVNLLDLAKESEAMEAQVGERRCYNCRYHDFMGGGEGPMICRRYAPRPKDSEVTAYWPDVEEDDWCGQHKFARPKW